MEVQDRQGTLEQRDPPERQEIMDPQEHLDLVGRLDSQVRME